MTDVLQNASQAKAVETVAKKPFGWTKKPSRKQRAYALRTGESPPAKPPIGGMQKRTFDVIFATGAICVLAPALALLAILIKVTDPGPILFRQKRIGFDGREFTCLKFRTMVVDAAERLEALLSASPEAAAEWASDQKLRVDPRITWIGRFLRKSSLDELPQLFNIIAGDMSLVGPRPVLRNELARYGARAEAYLSARPGLTGLWQVSGRNNTTYEERTKLDESYVRAWGLLRDIQIVALTVPVLLWGRGAF